MDNISPIGNKISSLRNEKTPERKVAEEFESVFLMQTLELMLKDVQPQSFGGGYAEETWRSILSQEYAKEIAKSGNTGIADSIENMINAYKTSMNKEKLP